MYDPRLLSRQIFVWRRMYPPTGNFRDGRRNARIYDLECEMDHLATSVSALLRGWNERTPWDFRILAAHRLQLLDRVSVLLDEAGLDTPDAEKFRAYLLATHDVLTHLSMSVPVGWRGRVSVDLSPMQGGEYGSARRVSYRYYDASHSTGPGLLRAVTSPLLHTDSVAYDARGCQLARSMLVSRGKSRLTSRLPERSQAGKTRPRIA